MSHQTNYRIKAPALASFTLSAAGRWTRVIFGLLLILGGLESGSLIGQIAGGIGALLVIAGAFNLCLLAPLIGGSISGRKMQQVLHEQTWHPSLHLTTRIWLQDL